MSCTQPASHIGSLPHLLLAQPLVYAQHIIGSHLEGGRAGGRVVAGARAWGGAG